MLNGLTAVLFTHLHSVDKYIIYQKGAFERPFLNFFLDFLYCIVSVKFLTNLNAAHVLRLERSNGILQSNLSAGFSTLYVA